METKIVTIEISEGEAKDLLFALGFLKKVGALNLEADILHKIGLRVCLETREWLKGKETTQK